MNKKELIEFLIYRGYEEVEKMTTDQLLDALEGEDEEYYQDTLDLMMLGMF